MMLLHLFVLFFIMVNSYDIYKIQKYVSSKELNLNEKTIISNILFHKYDNWAIKQAKLFRIKHYYKCINKNINLDELIFYSRIGLYKSAFKYKGYSSFTNYSIIYLNSELNKALNDAFSLSILPKHYRNKNKKNLTKLEAIRYKKLLYTNPTQSNFLLDKYNIKTYNYKKYIDYWIIINQFKPFEKRIFYLKFDFLFTKIRSNKEISLLMCCSEEYIRKTLNRSLEYMIKMADIELYHYHK